MVESNSQECVLTLEKRRQPIRELFFREIILADQVTEAVNNVRRAFRFAEEALSDGINLKVEVFFIKAEKSERKYFDEYKIDFKLYIQGETESAAEFLKQLSRIWIWWYKGYENVDPIEHFIKTAAECGTPADWWKVSGYVDSVESLTRESLKSDALELVEILKRKNQAFQELKRGIPCPLTGKICPTEIVSDHSLFFVAMPIQAEYEDVFMKIEEVFARYKLKAWVAQREVSRGHILCKICEKIQTCENGVFEITDLRPNVMLELGLAYGLGKSIVLLTKDVSKVPSDLKGLEVLEYKNLGQLETKLEDYIILNLNKP